jgi:hypothetical protein
MAGQAQKEDAVETDNTAKDPKVKFRIKCGAHEQGRGEARRVYTSGTAQNVFTERRSVIRALDPLGERFEELN